MTRVQRNFLATAGVLAVVFTVIAGNTARQVVEAGQGVASTGRTGLSGMLASTEPGGLISEAEYFYQLSQMLRREYVDPVVVDASFAAGAVRGMVGSLQDPYSLFMDAEHFGAFRQRLEGVYDGIGVEIGTDLPMAEWGQPVEESEGAMQSLDRVPDVVITFVAPGSSAERAGLQVGDLIRGVGDRVLMTRADVEAVEALRAQAAAGEVSARELNAQRQEIVERLNRLTTFSAVRRELMTGTEGAVALVFERDGTERQIQLNRGRTEIGPLQPSDLRGAYRPRFAQGVADAIRDLNGNAITLDLRAQGDADYALILEVVAALGFSGEVGAVQNERGSSPRPLMAQGRGQEREVTLLVGPETRGAYLVLAKLLRDRPGISLVGALPDRNAPWVEIFELPDGSGYTLNLGDVVRGEVTS